jgi:tagatose-1,6-bisphosphate aldolase
MASASSLSEAEILEHLVSPVKGDLSPEAARAILDLQFGGRATRHIRQLLQKNNRGRITADERTTLDKYLRVGQLIDLLQAKARLSLKEAGFSS